jgi:DNA (cytosine-5)-methyltransferase 1
MRFGSVCSGIEAASVAWHPLGWRASFLSEIEKFPRAVLSHHYPEVSLHGDFTTIKAGEYEPIDLLVGGTPCQSFSVAGLRGGLDDERGNLALEYLRLADRLRPRWLVWENVPGVLSSNGGRDFGSILGGMVQLGYGFAYRVLDAQFFGVPQRRRRVFVVGYLGDWRRAASVLFERHSLQGHLAPSREAGEGIAVCPTLRAGGNSTGGDRPPGTDVDTVESLIPVASTGHTAHCLNAGGMGRQGYETETLIAFSSKDHGADAGSIAPTLRAMGHAGSHANAGGQLAVAFDDRRGRAGDLSSRSDFANTLHGAKGLSEQQCVAFASSVRRLTPRECERLQGFPDDYTLIPYRKGMSADGPRYKALGNSMAVPVMAWIGERIAHVDAFSLECAA